MSTHTHPYRKKDSGNTAYLANRLIILAYRLELGQDSVRAQADMEIFTD